jgi:uncharacterized protein (DUF1501 family)
MHDLISKSRRKFLLRGAALGCSAAASPLLTPVSFASAPWDTRLVVIILRGGMDGLDVVQPYEDPALRKLRSTLSSGPDQGATDLDGRFALHGGLAGLLPLWNAGQLAFSHAVSTPYRDKRSHFDGQDLLEAGTGFAPGQPAPRDGWLNRMLQLMPNVQADTAYAIGREDLLLLTGDASVANWSPETKLSISSQAQRLLEVVYDSDPLFQASILEALELTSAIEADQDNTLDDEDSSAMAQMVQMASGASRNTLKLAEFAAQRLREDSRIAAFSINGWDTHRAQAGVLDKGLSTLADTILTLKTGLGDGIWGQTAVLAITEFGRTARENGTAGTDHGTGGAMLMAGGAVKGGKVYTNWPGLRDGDLYQDRDLMPTEDVRAYLASVMRDLIGVSSRDLETAIFPGLDMGSVGRVLL